MATLATQLTLCHSMCVHLDLWFTFNVKLGDCMRCVQNLMTRMLPKGETQSALFPPEILHCSGSHDNGKLPLATRWHGWPSVINGSTVWGVLQQYTALYQCCVGGVVQMTRCPVPVVFNDQFWWGWNVYGHTAEAWRLKPLHRQLCCVAGLNNGGFSSLKLWMTLQEWNRDSLDLQGSSKNQGRDGWEQKEQRKCFKM